MTSLTDHQVRTLALINEFGVIWNEWSASGDRTYATAHLALPIDEPVHVGTIRALERRSLLVFSFDEGDDEIPPHKVLVLTPGGRALLAERDNREVAGRAREALRVKLMWASPTGQQALRMLGPVPDSDSFA